MSRPTPTRLPRAFRGRPKRCRPAGSLRVIPLVLGPLLAALWTSPAAAEEGPPDARPNVVVILADDLGLGDVAPYATDAAIPTPHFARLAAEGLTLTDSHSPAAWCTPTRYGLLTGRYPGRQSLMRDDGPVIPEDHQTLPGWLRDRGYETAMLGKWHLGFAQDFRGGAENPSLAGGPSDRGFDSFYGIPRSLDIPPYYWLSDGAAVERPTRAVAANASGEPWSDIQGAFWRAGLAAPSFDFNDVTPEIVDRAEAFLGRRSDKDGPFFLYVALPSPHTPWLPSDAFRGRSDAGIYGDFVTQVDDAVGRLVTAVDSANVADRTLIWVSSDNGPVWTPDDFERTGHDAVAGFRGMKGDAHEGGHRVPMIVRYPGPVEASTTSAALTCHTDLFATVATMLGEEAPATALDSVDQWPVWTARNAPPARTSMVGEATGRFPFAREGRWKFIPALGSAGFTKPKFREPAAGEPPGQLYDLKADPAERTNLYDKHPDVVARMQTLIDGVRPPSGDGP